MIYRLTAKVRTRIGDFTVRAAAARLENVFIFRYKTAPLFLKSLFSDTKQAL
jgi:hypothetical protein